MPAATEAGLERAFEDWQVSAKALDFEGTRRSLERMVALRRELGTDALEPHAMVVMRAARERLALHDEQSALAFSEGAVQLAPGLPVLHVWRAQILFRTAPFEPAPYGTAIVKAVRALRAQASGWLSVRAVVLSACILAWVLTAFWVLTVLFSRRARTALHEFGHLWPKAATRWHEVLWFVWLLLLPFLLGYGLLPSLLLVFALLAAHLRATEALVVAVLLAGLGFVPQTLEWVRTETMFFGTRAATLARVEAGGSRLSPLVDELEKKALGPSPDFAEAFAAARFRLRRGEAKKAAALFEVAARTEPAEPTTLVNLGNALFALENLEGAITVYEEAARQDPRSEAVFHNLHRLYRRRAALKPPPEAAIELDRAREAILRLQGLDPQAAERSFAALKSDRLNEALMIPPLPRERLLQSRNFGLQRVPPSGLPKWLSGKVPSPWSRFYPSVLALVFLLMGALFRHLGVCRECQRCGRPVCRKCSPALSERSELCEECLTAFAPRAIVSAPFRTRKEVEVSRHRGSLVFWARLMGLLWPGAGHLHQGSLWRGALAVFLFGWLLAGVLTLATVSRQPYGPLPGWAAFGPPGLLAAGLYLASQVSLQRLLRR
jgi:tetratricopeptide (TPR) repeat protein